MSPNLFSEFQNYKILVDLAAKCKELSIDLIQFLLSFYLDLLSYYVLAHLAPNWFPSPIILPSNISIMT